MNEQVLSDLDDAAEERAPWRPLGAVAGDLLARALARRSGGEPALRPVFVPAAWAAE